MEWTEQAGLASWCACERAGEPAKDPKSLQNVTGLIEGLTRKQYKYTQRSKWYHLRKIVNFVIYIHIYTVNGNRFSLEQKNIRVLPHILYQIRYSYCFSLVFLLRDADPPPATPPLPSHAPFRSAPALTLML